MEKVVCMCWMKWISCNQTPVMIWCSLALTCAIWVLWLD
jgi:hypothetical protein